MPTATPTQIPPTAIPIPAATATPTQIPPTATPIPLATATPTQIPPAPTPTAPPVIIPVTSGKKYTCEDKDTYKYCVSSELAAPPAIPPETWGALVSFSPEVFCGTDVSDEVCELVASSLLAAMKAWGNYGPVEYWVVGPEVEALEKLANVNCQRRVDRGDYSDMDKCLEIQLDKTGEHTYKFEYYRAVSAGEVKSARGNTIGRSAGRNGNRHWGIHYFTSSFPGLGWGSQKLVFHEYFHAVQHAHLQTKDYDERGSTRVRGPRFHIESSADYMAFTALDQAHRSGDLDVGSTPYSYEETMEEILKIPGRPPYIWFYALLAHKFGHEVFLDVFYPNVEELGWEGSFVKAYGIPGREFHTEFVAFLDLPLDQQLAILPKVD